MKEEKLEIDQKEEAVKIDESAAAPLRLQDAAIVTVHVFFHEDRALAPISKHKFKVSKDLPISTLVLLAGKATECRGSLTTKLDGVALKWSTKVIQVMDSKEQSQITPNGDEEEGPASPTITLYYIKNSPFYSVSSTVSLNLPCFAAHEQVVAELVTPQLAARYKMNLPMMAAAVKFILKVDDAAIVSGIPPTVTKATKAYMTQFPTREDRLSRDEFQLLLKRVQLLPDIDTFFVPPEEYAMVMKRPSFRTRSTATKKH